MAALPFATKSPGSFQTLRLRIPAFLPGPVSPGSVTKVRFICQQPRNKSVAEPQIEFFYLLTSESYVVIKVDSHTSNYLYVAS